MPDRPRLLRLTALLGLVLTGSVLLPPVISAQAEPTSVLVLVRAAGSGAPLAGALVSIAGVGMQGTTDEHGELRLSGLAPGRRAVRAQFLGYATTTADVRILAGRSTEVVLDLPVQAIRLAELRVTTRRSLLDRNGFMGRQRAGFGTFVTREQITRMQPRFLSDVLRRLAGLSVSPTSFAGTSRASVRGSKVITGNCPIQYYIDGTMTAFFNVDDVRPEDVEGMEIYRGAATIPPSFNKGTALCGVVVIWTRDQ